MIKLLQGDCLQTMKTLADNSVDAIISDPPYGISFMAKKWDYDVPSVEVWEEAMRVLKPGGHALIACGTRTQHRMVVNIEDAGFEIRDVVSWIYGSGFPKSLNISKAIDKVAGAEREVVGVAGKSGSQRLAMAGDFKGGEYNTTAPATEAAKQWDGWGTALKPSSEFFTLCRKPLSEKTIAANVLKWGTGGINIDGCRVGTEENCSRKKSLVKDTAAGFGKGVAMGGNGHDAGRFPANLIHDGSQEVLELFPETKSGASKSSYIQKESENVAMSGKNYERRMPDRAADQGSAARFFYCAKASKKDRDEGNTHPTVKPTSLMQYLCRLITPAGGTVLDPYMGSGSTGKAAIKEGFSFVGCELDPEYYEIASARINAQAEEAGE
jgi:site-specific DNA-methyltransferase (adenine-specific)